MLDDKYFFSVVIPTYNSTGVILRTLESLKNQIYKNFEIILVDDNSADKDKLNLIVKGTGLRAAVINLSKKGNASISRNIGAKRASGQIICFLDSDDEFHPNKLFDLNCYISKFGFDDQAIYVNNFDISTNGVIISSSIHKSTFRLAEIDDYIFSNGNLIQTSSISLTKNAFLKFGFSENLSRFQDYAFLVSSKCLNGNCIIYSEAILSTWHRDPNYQLKMKSAGQDQLLIDKFNSTCGHLMSPFSSFCFNFRHGLSVSKYAGSFSKLIFITRMFVLHPIYFLKKLFLKISND